MDTNQFIIESEGKRFNFTAFLEKVLSSSEDNPAVLTDDEKQFVENCKRLNRY